MYKAILDPSQEQININIYGIYAIQLYRLYWC